MTYPPRDPAEHDEPVKLAQAVGERADAHPQAEPEDDEAEAEEYDPGDAGMSEYRHYADWAEVERAEYEAGL